MKGVMEELLEIGHTETLYFVLVAIVIIFWTQLGLHEFFGIVVSILILVPAFVVPPILIVRFLNKKKIKDKMEIRELDHEIFLKLLKKKKKN